jgi:hypothetical protein
MDVTEGAITEPSVGFGTGRMPAQLCALAARRLFHAAPMRPPRFHSVRTCAGTVLQLATVRYLAGDSVGVLHVPSSLRARHTLREGVRGETPGLLGWTGGWFGCNGILEGNIQAEGRDCDVGRGVI